MSLADREKTAVAPYRGPECSLHAALKILPQKEADSLRRLVFDRLDLSASTVSDLIDAEDEERAENGEPPLDISVYTVARHRRGDCRNCRKD